MVTTKEEENVLIAETTEEVDKPWEWQHDTLENQNIDRSVIENVHASLDSYFPQILESGSEYKNQITIWHLLTHTTGLEASDTAN